MSRNGNVEAFKKTKEFPMTKNGHSKTKLPAKYTNTINFFPFPFSNNDNESETVRNKFITSTKPETNFFFYFQTKLNNFLLTN